jgi:hypothetical protein
MTNSQRNRHRWMLLGIAGIGISAVVLLAAIGTSSASPNCLPCEVPPDQWSQLPPGKQELLQREQQQYTEALSQGQASQDMADQKNPAPQGTPAVESWPEGIFETGQAPLPHDYVIENQWQTTLPNGHVRVYAGSLASDPSQGLVVVLTTSLDLKQGTTQVYLTPAKTGPIRIFDSYGQQLSLISKGGALLTFDVSARQFVPSKPMPAWPSGTSELGQMSFPAGLPFPANMFNVENVWQGSVNGAYERVFAGSYLADPTQGLVIVQVVPSNLWIEPGSNDLSQALHLTHAKAGSLRITGATQGMMTLETASGSAFAFDTRSNQLVSQ